MTAAWGGLKPAPDRRLRRAFRHLPYSLLRRTMIEPHRVADDVGWKPVSAVAGHAVTLPAGGQVDNAPARHRHRAPSARRGRPWGPSSTPTSRTTTSGSSGPTAPLAAGPPISPPSSAATWDEIDKAGGVIRLSPARSKTLVGRILPISPPIADALNRRRARRDPDSPLVFHRDGITIRRWRTAWRTACQAAGVPTRFLHDCRRTAARNLIRANVPERVAMLLTGHKSRAIFDRYNIIDEQELLDAGDQPVAYLAQQAQAVPARQRPHPAGPAAPRTASPLRLVRRGTA